MEDEDFGFAKRTDNVLKKVLMNNHTKIQLIKLDI